MKRVAMVVVLVMISVVMLFGAGCTEDDPVYDGDGDVAEANGLEILTHAGTWKGEYYPTYTVRGTAKNTGDSNLDYTEIRVKGFDAEGNVLGTSMTNVMDLGPGQTWNFDCLVLDSEGLERYEIAVGSAW